MTIWEPQAGTHKNIYFFKKHHFGYHRNHLKVFGCLGSCFVYSCGSSLKFSPEDHGRPDPRTWRRASTAAVQLGKIQTCCKKDSIFFFRFIFVFSFFFDCFFRFCFRLLSNCLVFESHLTKSKNCPKKNSNFLRFVSFFSRFFSFFIELFSNREGIFNLFSNYFRLPKKNRHFFELRKNFLKKKIEPEAPSDFLFVITGATLARVVATS